MFGGADDSRGASSVIGVVLLVAVVVILGSTVGAFAFGIVGDSASDPQPTGFTATQDGPFGDVEASGTVAFVVQGGDPVPADELTVTVGGQPASSAGVDVALPGSTLTAGERVTVSQAVAGGITAGDTVTLVHQSPDGGETTVLAEVTANGGSAIPQDPELVFTAYEVGTKPGSPWSVAANSKGGVAYAGVKDAKAAVGDRSFWAHVESPNHDVGTVTASLGGVNFSAVETVSFQHTGDVSGDDLTVSVDGCSVPEAQQVATHGAWETSEVDVGGCNADTKVTFHFEAATNDASRDIYLDDVTFLDADGDRVPLSELLD